MTAPDIGALRSLRDRVAAAGGPDREIDQDLFCDLGLCPRGEDGVLDAYRAPRYTESLDAVVALVGHVLPDWWWAVARTPAKGWFEGEVYPPNYDSGDPLCGVGGAPQPALALCAALLSALVAQREHDGATTPRGTGTAGEGEDTPGPDGRRGETTC